MAAYTPDLPVHRRPQWVAAGPTRCFAPHAAAPMGRLLGILSVDEADLRPQTDRRRDRRPRRCLRARGGLAVQGGPGKRRRAPKAKPRSARTTARRLPRPLNETSDTAEAAGPRVPQRSPKPSASRRSPYSCSRDDGLHRTAAIVGFAEGQNSGSPLNADELERLLQPDFDVAGLLSWIPHTEAQPRRLLPERPAGYRSQRDGPRSLRLAQTTGFFVPLHDRSRGGGNRLHLGPTTRSTGCTPDPERLQILRAFAEPGDDGARGRRPSSKRSRTPTSTIARLIERVARGDRRLRSSTAESVRGTAEQTEMFGWRPPTQRSATSTRPCRTKDLAFFPRQTWRASGTGRRCVTSTYRPAPLRRAR